MTVGARVAYVAPYIRPERPLCRIGVITHISVASRPNYYLRIARGRNGGRSNGCNWSARPGCSSCFSCNALPKGYRA